jgi:hypothetical protein
MPVAGAPFARRTSTVTVPCAMNVRSRVRFWFSDTVTSTCAITFVTGSFAQSRYVSVGTLARVNVPFEKFDHSPQVPPPVWLATRTYACRPLIAVPSA